MTEYRTVPTAEQEEQFWTLLEAAWAPLGPGPNAARQRLTTGSGEAEEVDQALEAVLANLSRSCDTLSAEQLTNLDRVLELKLHAIDRQEIQAVTDGSDDGFLYARGLIVALGQTYYEAVSARPELAILDGECEEMCYFFAHEQEKRFGTWPTTNSGISRESGSNTAGWS